jgi:hypothetical protein
MHIPTHRVEPEPSTYTKTSRVESSHVPMTLRAFGHSHVEYITLLHRSHPRFLSPESPSFSPISKCITTSRLNRIQNEFLRDVLLTSSPYKSIASETSFRTSLTSSLIPTGPHITHSRTNSYQNLRWNTREDTIGVLLGEVPYRAY